MVQKNQRKLSRENYQHFLAFYEILQLIPLTKVETFMLLQPKMETLLNGFEIVDWK